MTDKSIDERFDLARIIVKPLYFGLTVNIMIPMGILLVCFWMNDNYEPANILGQLQNTVFGVFAFLAVSEAGLILWWRTKILQRPMIRREETFETDFSQSLLKHSKPIFLAISSIGLYGFLFFFLTGELKETVLLVVFSFIVFQVVRPRYGFVRKLIAFQEELVKQGSFKEKFLG